MDARVLIVDDNEINRQLIEWALEDRAEITSLDDGRQCCDAALALKPDAIFLDLMMPEYSGFDVLAEMQARAPDAIAKVVVVTARDDAETRERVGKYGVRECRSKPLSIDQINSCFDAIRNA